MIPIWAAGPIVGLDLVAVALAIVWVAGGIVQATFDPMERT